MILLIFAITWNYVCCFVALNLDDFRFFLLMLKVAWNFQVRIVFSFCRSFWSWSQTSWASLYFRTKNQYQIWLSLCTRFNWSDIICLIFDSHRSQQVEKTFTLGRLLWEFKKLFLLYELILIILPFLLELGVWLPSFASWSITHLLTLSAPNATIVDLIKIPTCTNKLPPLGTLRYPKQKSQLVSWNTFSLQTTKNV